MATTKVTTDVIDMSGNAGGLTWVKGTTLQRPSGVIGEIRENTDTKRTEVYTDETTPATWRNLKEVPAIIAVEYLVVAGGASGAGAGTGGAQFGGGGGGAGGYRTNYGGTALPLSKATNYTVSVGLGGGSVFGLNDGNNGTDSSFSGSFTGSPITSTGGGGGGHDAGAAGRDGKTGGSGGGGASSGGAGGAGNTPFTNPSQGTDGGLSSTPNGQGGGGGGADPVGTSNRNGGDGLENQITGATGIFYAGGGGGGIYSAGQAAGIGGSGIGGNGAPINSPGGNGSINKGSGGGGGSDGNGNSGLGGSGIVILRCTAATATLGSGITVNSTAGPGTVNGVSITGTSDYYYSATLGTGTITF